MAYSVRSSPFIPSGVPFHADKQEPDKMDLDPPKEPSDAFQVGSQGTSDIFAVQRPMITSLAAQQTDIARRMAEVERKQGENARKKSDLSSGTPDSKAQLKSLITRCSGKLSNIDREFDEILKAGSGSNQLKEEYLEIAWKKKEKYLEIAWKKHGLLERKQQLEKDSQVLSEAFIREERDLDKEFLLAIKQLSPDLETGAKQLGKPSGYAQGIRTELAQMTCALKNMRSHLELLEQSHREQSFDSSQTMEDS